MTDIREELLIYVTELVSKELNTTTLPKSFKDDLIKQISDMFRTSKKRLEDDVDLSELVAEETGIDVRKAEMIIECKYNAAITNGSIFFLEIKPMAHDVALDYDESTAAGALIDELYEYSNKFELYVEIKYSTYINKLIVQELTNHNLIISEMLNSSYRLIQANTETIIGNGADKLLAQLKSEDKYDSWVGVASDASKTSGPVNINELPVFGHADKYETKWFYNDRSDAIVTAKSTLRDMCWY